jgi:uncharacterized protein (TIGR00162 family)
MSTKIHEFEKPKLTNPLFIEGLPGIGHVGRIAAGYLIEELKAKKFAELLSSHFMHYVLLHESSAVHMLKNEFYYWKARGSGQRDLIIMIGDSQSVDPEGHYEIANETLEFVKKFGTKEIVTLAGFGVGEAKAKPRIIGAVSDQELIKKYKKYNIDFDAGSKIGTIVGASGLFLGLGKYYGIDGICLLGETAGYPILPDPKAAEAILKVLSSMLNIKLDTSRLDKRVKEMEEFIKKIEDMQKKAFTQMSAGKAEKTEKEELRYIG